MRQSFIFGVGLGIRRNRHSRAAAVAVAMLALGLSASPAAGQAVPSAPSAAPPPVCDVQVSERFAAALGSSTQVLALCGGYGLLLGPADTFEVYRNEGLAAMLVDLRRGSDRRVLLISLQGESPPLLEDLSGQISMAAGRGPMSPLEGVGIDVARFARDGSIGVDGPGASGANVGASTINLGRQVAQVRSARTGAASE
jgi:hypothetical protein